MSYTLTGECKWAHVQQPNTKFEPVYSIDVIIDDENMQKVLEKHGFRVKQYKDGSGTYLTIKRKVANRKGQPVPPPKVVDEHGAEITDLIGNGSVVTVTFDGIEWSNSSFGSGTSAYLKEVMVHELKEFAKKIDLNAEVAA